MAESIHSRGSNTLCAITTNVIVIIGVLGFLYVGQQLSHVGSRMDTAIQSSTTSR